MNYLIEIVRSNAQFKDYWLARADDLNAMSAGIVMELYSFNEDIRNADYSHLSILKFDSPEQRADFLFHPTRLLEQKFETDRVECDLDIEIGLLSDAASGHVFLINPFEIQQEDIPAVLDMWHKAKGHMIAHEGFINARLFRSSDPSAKYGLVNVAHWRSSKSFKDAFNDQAYDSHRERSLNYKLHPSLCKFEARFST